MYINVHVCIEYHIVIIICTLGALSMQTMGATSNTSDVILTCASLDLRVFLILHCFQYQNNGNVFHVKCTASCIKCLS